MSGISCFMHRNTPRRLMSKIRSHSSSLTSAAGPTGCSTPALLNAMSSRPNASNVWSSAALTSWPLVTSHRTTSTRPPWSSISPAVSRLPCSDTSATTTVAPADAKATAVARPIPLAAPVTKATFPTKLPWSVFAAMVWRRPFSVPRQVPEAQQGLIKSFVHRGLSLSRPVQAHRQVEHLAGVDASVADQVYQFGQEAPYVPDPRGAGRVPCHGDVRGYR